MLSKHNFPHFSSKTLSLLWRSSAKDLFLGVIAALLLVGVAYGGHLLYTGKTFLLIQNDTFSWSRFYFNRGNYFFGGAAYNLDAAYSNYQKALALPGSEQIPIRYQIGRIHFIRGELHAALEEFNKEAKQKPEFNKVYYMRGLTYGYLHDLENAEKDLKYLAQLELKPWAVYNDLVWVYFRQGNFDKAEEYARKGLVYNPENPWLHNALGTTLLNRKHFKEAKEHLVKADSLFAELTVEDWGKAYPGNDPRMYAEGYASMKSSIEKNLALVEARITSE